MAEKRAERRFGRDGCFEHLPAASPLFPAVELLAQFLVEPRHCAQGFGALRGRFTIRGLYSSSMMGLCSLKRISLIPLAPVTSSIFALTTSLTTSQYMSRVSW